MRRETIKSIITIGFLVFVIGVAVSSLYGNTPKPSHNPPGISSNNGPVMLSAHLVQDKVFTGGEGTVSLSLTMKADELPLLVQGDAQHVDMVIVLDQSGSMRGQKIEYARQAVLNLLDGLTAQDRVAIVGYSEHVRTYSELLPVSDTNLETLQSIVYGLSTGGHTNLGGGLQEGIHTLLSAKRIGNIEKVILISDGLANRGVTAPAALGNIASSAVQEEFAVSTVGVGNDFNEQLMTAIADRGAGNYYYLSDPQSFAQIFLEEFQNTRMVAAHALEIQIPLSDGVSLVKASGYPITLTGHQASVHPGDLLSGQRRKLFLTLHVPTHAEQIFEVNGLNIRYLHRGTSYMSRLAAPLQIACVNDPNEVTASIDAGEWEEKVIQEDFNALREEVSIDLKNGRKHEAKQKIDAYYDQQYSLNSQVQSLRVEDHLENEVDGLRDFVDETFAGSPQEIAEQQKANAKELQYKGYKTRRSK